MLKKISFKSNDDLVKHIKTHLPTFYYSSKTSTVIPYEKLEEIYKDEDFYLGDLSLLPASMNLLENGNLHVKGPVSWKDAKVFLNSKGRNIMTAPTEELALITAGAATSCTGERCFAFGNLRSQIKKIKYLDFNGNEKELLSENSFPHSSQMIEKYNRNFEKYSQFKNAPYPRLTKETDLLIGTEGQLGVITEVELLTVDDFQVNHLFMLVPKWEENIEPHLEINRKIQSFRENVILCEHIDSNSFNYLKPNDRPNRDMDAIFFEVKSSFFEDFYEKFLLDLSFLNEELVFELSSKNFHQLRASIPRAVYEENSIKGITKKGTDVQVTSENFRVLLEKYKSFTKAGIKYNLFGHFGDSHLHFNFMPNKDQIHLCESELQGLYKLVAKLSGSPFAEHGVGIIKQKYICDFWDDTIISVFKELKQQHDPQNQFFPQGYMNLNCS